MPNKVWIDIVKNDTFPLFTIMPRKVLNFSKLLNLLRKENKIPSEAFWKAPSHTSCKC